MKYLLGLEITDHKVRYVFFEKRGGTTVIHRVGSISQTIIPSQKGSLTRAILDILKKENLEASQVYLTISRRDSVIHQLVLPKLPKNELEGVIQDEIEKIPVFLDKQYEYIYQIYEHTPEKNRIVFAAVKNFFLQYLVDEISKTKLKFSDIEIAPLNFPGVLQLLAPNKEDQALIVVEDRTTYFIVFNKTDYKYVYSTHTGALDVFYNGTTQANQNILNGLADEVRRVEKSYLLEHKKEHFSRVWLLSDKEAAPGLNDLLAQQLNITVEEPNLGRIPGLQMATTANTENPIYVLSATPIIHHAKNLKPRFPFNFYFKKSNSAANSFAKSALESLIVFGIISIVLWQFMNNFNKKTAENEEQINTISQEITKLTTESQSLLKERERYLLVRQQLLDQATFVSLLNQPSWSEVLSEVSSKLPEEMALTSFKVSESGEVNFNGEAFEMESVSDMIRKVDVSELINNGRFKFLKEKLVERQKIYTYGVLADIKKAPLPQEPVASQPRTQNSEKPQELTKNGKTNY